jgi:predicted O-methyltransferase YrrM
MRDNINTSAKHDYLNSLIKATSQQEFVRLADKARNDSVQIGKASISLSYFEANCLHQVIKQHSCKNFIELGSLTGFSGVFILSALAKNGKLFCFEKDIKWIPFLQENLTQALNLKENAGKSFSIVSGDALENLKKFSIDEPVDGFFIDANKSAYLEYLLLAESLLKPGGIIVADNVYLDGSVWGLTSERFSKKQVEVMKEFNQRIFDSNKFTSLFLDTSDGMIVAIKK